MKITDIKPYPVWVGHRNQLIVKIETDEGIYGWGESGLSGREMAVVGALNHYREFLIGRNPMQIGALWQEMYRSQYFEGGRVLTAAISAMDIALYDIAGKALGVPVYQLLGGKQREVVPCFATVRAESTAEELIEGAKLLLSKGWNVIRVSLPRPYEPDSLNLWSRANRSGRRHIGSAKLRAALGPESGAGHRLSSSAERGRERVVLPAYAHGHTRLSRRADPR